MLLTKLPAMPAPPGPQGSSSSRSRTPLEAALGNCLHTSHLSPSLPSGCRGTPRTPPERHIRISQSWNTCGCPGRWAYHQVNVPGKGQHCHAAAQLAYAPYCSVGSAYMLMKKHSLSLEREFLNADASCTHVHWSCTCLCVCILMVQRSWWLELIFCFSQKSFCM